MAIVKVLPGPTTCNERWVDDAWVRCGCACKEKKVEWAAFYNTLHVRIAAKCAGKYSACNRRGRLLSSAAHIIATRPIVRLEIGVFRFELERARLRLKCAGLLEQSGSPLADQRREVAGTSEGYVVKLKQTRSFQIDSRACD